MLLRGDKAIREQPMAQFDRIRRVYFGQPEGAGRDDLSGRPGRADNPRGSGRPV